MKLNNRIFSFILVLTMIISNIGIVNAKTDDTFTGKVNMNLSTDGSKMLDHLQDASLNLKNLHITGNNDLQLIGEINYADISSSIHLKGDLRKSKLYKNTLVGNISDKSDNFDVIYFAITSNEDKSKLFTNKSIGSKEVIKLYLMRKTSREFVMFEIPVDKLESKTKSAVSVNYNERKLRETAADDHWWFKVLKPVNLSENKLKPLGATTDTSYFEETYRYELTFGYYDYYIKLKAFANVYDMTGGQATDEAGLEIISEKLTDDTGKVLESNESYLQIKNCIGKGELYTNKYSLSSFYDVVTSFAWGHEVTESVGGLTISPGLWIGNVVGLGVTYSLETTSVDQDGLKTFPITDKIKGAKVTYKKALTAIGDSYSLTMTKYRPKSSSVYKYGIYDFTFDIYFENGGKVSSGIVQASAKYE